MRSGTSRRTAGWPALFRRLARPWTLILIVTGLFQVFRGAPVDGAFFLVIATVLIVDAAGLVHVSGAAPPRAAWLLAAAVPLALLLVLSPRHGVVEGIIVSAIGITVFIFAWGEDGATGATLSPAVRRAAILWSIVGVLACLWEVASFLLGLPSPAAANAHPSISELFDPMLDSVAGRAIFTVLWLLLGVALVRRRAPTATPGEHTVRRATRTSLLRGQRRSRR